MWKILNNVSSAAASLNKYQSQTKSSLIKREIEKRALCDTKRACGLNSQNSAMPHMLTVVPTFLTMHKIKIYNNIWTIQILLYIKYQVIKIYKSNT